MSKDTLKLAHLLKEIINEVGDLQNIQPQLPGAESGIREQCWLRSSARCTQLPGEEEQAEGGSQHPALEHSEKNEPTDPCSTAVPLVPVPAAPSQAREPQ